MDSCNRLGKTRRPQISVEIDYILSFPDEIVKRFTLTPKSDDTRRSARRLDNHIQ